MAGVITVGGLATGIDTQSIITQLVALEHRPVDLLGLDVEGVQATQASITSLTSKLGTLSAAAHALDTADGVLVRQATSSDLGVLEAAAGTGAQPGSVTLTVGELARGSVAGATVGVASASSTVASGPGTFQFQVGSGTVQSVAVDATTTLAGLASAINALDAGVTASAVNLATDSTVKHLVARLHEVFSEAVGGTYTNLSSLGLATQQDGTITFDESKFHSALGTDATAVAETFAGNGTAHGVARDFGALIDDMTAAGGSLAIHSTALDAQIRSLQDQIDAGQREADAFEANLRAQFTALESFVSGLKSQGSFLTQAFGR